jgi:hypothetical protein
MNTYISVCSTEMYQQTYMEFLLKHYAQLNLPYSYPVTLSFLASPIMMEREAFLCFNDEEEVVGAFSYIYGTGDNQYEDVHVIQIQVAFLLEDYRSTRLFLQALQFLTEYISHLGENVEELRFWTPADEKLRRLFGKIAENTASVDTSFGTLDEYRASFSSLQAYGAKFPHEPFF